jgi:hypothetical protein
MFGSAGVADPRYGLSGVKISNATAGDDVSDPPPENVGPVAVIDKDKFDGGFGRRTAFDATVIVILVSV